MLRQCEWYSDVQIDLKGDLLYTMDGQKTEEQNHVNMENTHTFKTSLSIYYLIINKC